MIGPHVGARSGPSAVDAVIAVSCLLFVGALAHVVTVAKKIPRRPALRVRTR